jgi:hypothetical protein
MQHLPGRIFRPTSKQIINDQEEPMENELPPGARRKQGLGDKQKPLSINFTEGQILRINRHVLKLESNLPDDSNINFSRHAFMKQTILNAIMED